MKLLHILASPRGGGSTTQLIADALLGELAASDTSLTVDTLDLFDHDLPAFTGPCIEAKYTLLRGGAIHEEHRDAWARIEDEIARFTSADTIVVSAPMWNFGIPYPLKHYIDCIVQPGYLFRFDEGGMPVPLVHGKRMVVVTSSGSDYSSSSPLHSIDFHEQYLRAIFAFVGIDDVTFVHGHSMDVPHRRDAGLVDALDEARTVARDGRWPRPVETAA
jgi:FMN-dependent NADH-azoreductase